MNLNENIYRLKELMGLLKEQDEDRIAVLIDGTSSAGKSKTAQMLNAVPFYEATDKNQWVQIDSDMFGCEKDYCIENRMKYDHAGDGPNPDAGEQFHREMADKRKNHNYGSKRGQTTVGFHLHPHNKDLIPNVDSRNWYMAQEYKHGGWKKVIFDDIDKGLKQYIPEVKHILLHAPIYILLQNVAGRPKGDPRDPKEVLGQYLEKYEATKEMPSENTGDPSTILTKKGLEGLLSESISDKEFIDSFIQQLGIMDDGQYYIKVKDDYLTPDTQLINVDSEKTVYLNKFKDVIQNNY
jgi:hypothetical protein